MMADWSAQTTILGSDLHSIALYRQGRRLSCGEFVQALAGDKAFARFFAEQLQASPFQAYYWETPPFDTASLTRDFEYVLIDAPRLNTMLPDRVAFAEYFSAADNNDTVVCFPNLGGDARLVVPCPLPQSLDYAHLGVFMRSAPAEQIETLWATVGAQALAMLGRERIWISTAGDGVAWLHIRIDSFPKYYHHQPYRI